MSTTPNPVDYLKYVTAESLPLLESARDTLSCIDGHQTADDRIAIMDDIDGLLDAVRATIVEATAVFCRDGDDMNTYADGRPVVTRTDLEPGHYFSYSWHPQIGHHDDRPRDLCFVDQSDGTRKRIVVVGPGVIEAVPVRPLRAV